METLPTHPIVSNGNKINLSLGLIDYENKFSHLMIYNRSYLSLSIEIAKSANIYAEAIEIHKYFILIL